MAVLSVALVPLLTALVQTPSQETPAEPRGLRVREAGALEGYTLVSPLRSKSVYLIGMDGEVAHEWETAHPPGEWLYFRPDGRLLRSARKSDNPRFSGGGIGGLLQELDWDGKVLWEFELSDDYQTMHHDIEPMPNGNVLVIAWEHRYREDALAAGRDPAHLGEAGMWPDAVLEIRPSRPTGGEIVWEWHAWDHLVQDRDPALDHYGAIAEHPGRIDVNADHRGEAPPTPEELAKLAEVAEQMQALGYAGDAADAGAPAAARPGETRPDWMHTNSIDYHPELDLVVINSPELGEFYVIDHSTTVEEAAGSKGGRWKKGGDVLYRWGNPKNYGAGTSADRRLFYQHDVRWLAGAGASELRVLLFNNGQGRPAGDFSSVEELVLPFDTTQGFLREAGKPFGPAEPAWTYSDPPRLYAAFISGAERLTNGNTLVCSGPEGRVIEVTREGKIVWEWLNPHGGDVAQDPKAGTAPPVALFRATRIPKGHPALAAHGL
jgi:hypothetical protein